MYPHLSLPRHLSLILHYSACVIRSFGATFKIGEWSNVQEKQASRKNVLRELGCTHRQMRRVGMLEEGEGGDDGILDDSV